MKSKSLLFAFATTLAVFVPQIVRAQEGPPPPPPAEGKGPRGGGGRMGPNLEQMASELNLTDDQKAKIKPILEDARKQGQAIRDDESLAPEDKRSKAMALRKSIHDQVFPILTPEQQKKFEDMRQNAPRGEGKKKSDT